MVEQPVREFVPEAMAVGLSWTGSATSSANRLRFTDNTLAAFAKLHPVGALWRAECLSSIILRALEEEGCAPALNGASAGALDTARGAGIKPRLCGER